MSKLERQIPQDISKTSLSEMLTTSAAILEDNHPLPRRKLLAIATGSLLAIAATADFYGTTLPTETAVKNAEKAPSIQTILRKPFVVRSVIDTLIGFTGAALMGYGFHKK